MLDQPMAAGRRPKLLLVEDDAVTRELLARRLDVRGCEVIAVDAAEEGIIEAGQIAFDTVVADVHLPGMSGIDLASYLLAHDPGMPVILITGDMDEELARDALSLGPVSYLVKPIQPFELESVVQQALTRRGWRVDAEGRLVRDEPAGPEVPKEWLEYVESESFAGPGHGDRVARIALLLHEEIQVDGGDVTPEVVALAARTHEVGRLGSPDAEPAITAAQSAELMAEAGFPRAAVRAVRHMREHWDGTGGPDGLSGANIPTGARILAIADSLDHYSAAWLRGGLNCDNAVDRAIHLVTVQQSRVFGPVAIAALHRRIEDVRRVIVEWHGSESNETLTTAAFSTRLADVPFKVA
jgi:response regulator RpfG family c-di-GMP phosphodiesterase